MLPTVDWEDETITKSQTENYSGGTSAASVSRLTSALAVIGVLGTLTNGLVLGGFWYAGRAKMNVSGAHIANRTTLEQSTSFRMYRDSVS